jgi:hypothetical protein
MRRALDAISVALLRAASPRVDRDHEPGPAGARAEPG